MYVLIPPYGAPIIFIIMFELELNPTIQHACSSCLWICGSGTLLCSRHGRRGGGGGYAVGILSPLSIFMAKGFAQALLWSSWGGCSGGLACGVESACCLFRTWFCAGGYGTGACSTSTALTSSTYPMFSSSWRHPIRAFAFMTSRPPEQRRSAQLQ